MKGYYCIYDSANDCWWSTYEYWISHRDMMLENITDGYELQSNISSYNNSLEIQLIDKSTRSITFLSPFNTLKRDDIMTFNTVSETESYILSYEWPEIGPNSFLSIRKIYY